MAEFGIFSLHVVAGKKTRVVLPAMLRLSGAALDSELADETKRTTLKLHFQQMGGGSDDEDEDDAEDEEKSLTKGSTILCSLTPGKIEQSPLNLVCQQDDTLEFELIGPNDIHLSGNYIVGDGPDSDDEGSFDDEEGYGLDEISSDVEIGPDELDELEIDSDEEGDASRFEELPDDDDEPEPPKGTKRARDSDAMEEDQPAEEKLSKSQRKKLNKKLKAQDGSAVAPAVSEPAKPQPAAQEKTEKKKDKKDKKQKEAGAKEGGEKDAGEKKAGGKKELPGGIIIDDKKVGTGKVAKKGSKLAMRYIGKLSNGKVFDSNTKGNPFSFRLGAGEVIKGWDEGIVGMQVGGERVLTIPPALAYGKKGSGKDIPPNATLTFEVKLVDVK